MVDPIKEIENCLGISTAELLVGKFFQCLPTCYEYKILSVSKDSLLAQSEKEVWINSSSFFRKNILQEHFRKIYHSDDYTESLLERWFDES